MQISMNKMIGHNIRERRNYWQYTQHGLANRLNDYGLNWTQGHVSRAEQGRIMGLNSLPVLAALCIVLRCSIKRLLALPDEYEGISDIYVRITPGNYLKYDSLIEMFDMAGGTPTLFDGPDNTQNISLQEEDLY